MQCIAFLSLTASLYNKVENTFQEKHTNVFRPHAGRFRGSGYLYIQPRYRRHNMEKSVPSRLYAVNSNKGRHPEAPTNFAMKGG